MPTVEHAGASLHYEQHGHHGDPVLLIMGLGVDSTFWLRQTPLFAERHRVIVLDNRGVGRSSKPVGPYSIRLLAEDARAVLDAAGIARAHVVGLSMGGMIAQELALRDADRVGALVLAATYARIAVQPSPTGSDPPAAARLADHSVEETSVARANTVGASPLLLMADASPSALASLDMKRLFKLMVSLVLSSEFIARERELLRAWMQRALVEGSVDAFVAQLRAALAHDVAAELARVRAPTLVITGTDDQLVPPRCSDELARLIPGATLVRIDGGPHGFNLERAEEFNRPVLEFLAAHPL
jgi:pimeloyl-ACP methyl ester carboxylesterase